jgi:hypothetical protein
VVIVVVVAGALVIVVVSLSDVTNIALPDIL